MPPPWRVWWNVLPDRSVSALIVVHDGERHLAEAIESVLAQTRPAAELVVVDNASTDRSGEIARDFGGIVRVVEEPRLGVGHARNAALEAAAGEYLSFLDHDDLWEPHRLEVQLAAFEEDPDLDIVFGHVVQFLDGVDPELAARIKVSTEPQPGLNISTILAPRRTWDRVGSWSGSEQVGEGLVWLVRANDLGLRRRMLADVVARRRIHGDNMSFANHDHRGEWIATLKASLDARRKRGQA